MRERSRDVDRELVRRRILARVQTLAAVVAQVCEISQIPWRKAPPFLHRAENSTVAFAVPAGVAHHHDALGFAHGRVERPDR